LSQGLKPAFLRAFNFRAEARTYHKGKGNGNGNGKSKGNGNRRSFDSVTRKCASHFAQDDTLFVGN